MELEGAAVKVVLGYMVRSDLVWREGPREYEDRELVDRCMVVGIAALARTDRRRWVSGGRVSTHSRALTVGGETGTLGAGCLLGLRRRMRIILVGCRM